MMRHTPSAGTTHFGFESVEAVAASATGKPRERFSSSVKASPDCNLRRAIRVSATGAVGGVAFDAAVIPSSVFVFTADLV
jgi:hypothetical protein